MVSINNAITIKVKRFDLNPSIINTRPWLYFYNTRNIVYLTSIETAIHTNHYYSTTFLITHLIKRKKQQSFRL